MEGKGRKNGLSEFIFLCFVLPTAAGFHVAKRPVWKFWSSRLYLLRLGLPCAVLEGSFKREIKYCSLFSLSPLGFSFSPRKSQGLILAYSLPTLTFVTVNKISSSFLGFSLSGLCCWLTNTRCVLSSGPLHLQPSCLNDSTGSPSIYMAHNLNSWPLSSLNPYLLKDSVLAKPHSVKTEWFVSPLKTFQKGFVCLFFEYVVCLGTHKSQKASDSLEWELQEVVDWPKWAQLPVLNANLFPPSFIFKDRVLLRSPGYPGIHGGAAQAVL